MTLQKREKILAISALALLVLLALYWFWPASVGTLEELRAQRDAKKSERDNNENRELMAKKAATRLKDWQRRALPANQETAHSLYQNWLRNLINTAGFSNVVFTSNQPVSVRDMSSKVANVKKTPGAAAQAANNIYVQLSFTIQCQGSLDKLTKFLYDFYSGGHLHKINSLNITPVKNSSDLGLVLTVRALSLPTALQKDKLYIESGKLLKLSLDDYKKSIVGRNLFAAYKPPPKRNTRGDGPPPPPPDPKLDLLQFSYLTAIIEADGVPEAWLFERTTGQTLRLHEGDDFTIAKVKGKIVRIGYNEIEIEIDGKNHTVSYGSNLKM